MGARRSKLFGRFMPSFGSLKWLTSPTRLHVFAIHANGAYKLTCWETLIWFRKTLSLFVTTFWSFKCCHLLSWPTYNKTNVNNSHIIMPKSNSQRKRQKAVLGLNANIILWFNIKMTKLLSAKNSSKKDLRQNSICSWTSIYFISAQLLVLL